MVLVVGSTGVLGGTVCRLLQGAGHEVRALVRETSDPEKVQALKRLGAEIAVGDLKDPRSLESACSGVATVITTVSSTRSRQEGDSITTVDRQGQLDLISAARASAVEHLIYVSFHTMAERFPLQSAKRTVEQALVDSGLTYTILQSTFFMEVWLGPHLGFQALDAKARLYGSGENPIPWISLDDVAAFLVAAVGNAAVRNRTVELGGPEHLSPLEVVKRFEDLSGREFEIERVPEDALRAKLESATDLLEQSFAGLMLGYHQGYSIDMSPVLEMMPVNQTYLNDYAARILKVSPNF